MSAFHTLAVHAGERMPRPDPSTSLRSAFTPDATPEGGEAAFWGLMDAELREIQANLAELR
jgi:hypothetical protein